MVSPLFVEIYGYFILLSLIRLSAFYLANKISLEVNRSLYFRALNKSKDINEIFILGELYYSFDFPTKKNYLDFMLNGFDDTGFQQKRIILIKNDLKCIKLAG